MKNATLKFKSPIGQLQLSTTQSELVELNLGMDSKKNRFYSSENTMESTSSYAQHVKEQIEAYFSKRSFEFHVNMSMTGTQFQKSVWEIIKSIKFGDTMTYSDIACMLDSSPRAVGNACRANPIPIIVPCHRVIAKSGLGGFAGQRSGRNLDVKTWLLEHEQVC